MAITTYTQNTGELVPYLFDFGAATLDSTGTPVRALASSTVTTATGLTAGTKTNDTVNAVVQQFLSATAAGTYAVRCHAVFDDAAELDLEGLVTVVVPTI